MSKTKNKTNKTESQEMESLIRKQLKDIVKLLKQEGYIATFTHDDTPMLVATLNAALENKLLIDSVTKQMLDIDWDTDPVRF